MCVGASNKLPEDEQLAAFADRFLLRAYVAPVGDSRLEELLLGAWSLGGDADAETLATVQDLDVLARAARAIDMAGLRPEIAHALRTLRAAGVALSDRRAARTQRLIAAAAAIAGREIATRADLWPIVFAVPTEEGQRLARDVLRDQLAPAENAALPAAAADGSLGPVARAARIVELGNALFARGAGELRERHELEVEAVAREIDAGFARDEMPPELAALRDRIVTALGRRDGAERSRIGEPAAP